MFKPKPFHKPDYVELVLVPDFSLMAVSSLVETMRLANYLSGTDLYEWRLVSSDGQPVRASGGIEMIPSASFADVTTPDNVVVCSGIHVNKSENEELLHWLRRVARGGAHIGGLCTATWLLARAGIMNGYRCTIHWMNIESFQEKFPDIEVNADLFEIDRDRFTCAGGVAPVDMMLHSIEKQHGRGLSLQICEQFMHERPRLGNEDDVLPLYSRLHVKNPRLLQAITMMERNIEITLTRAEIASEIGLSCRQMERLFRYHVGASPARYYMQIRLKKAQRLLHQTSLSVTEIAFACGFSSASHFSKCYRETFCCTPRFARLQAFDNGYAAMNEDRSASIPAETEASLDEQEEVALGFTVDMMMVDDMKPNSGQRKTH